MPTKDFYYFKYKFKPESIDETKPGILEPKPGESGFRLEHSSTQGDGHVYNGVEQAPNGWECVLIYDEETGAYTLEKLDSTWDLSYDRNGKGPRRSPNLGIETPLSESLDNQQVIQQDLREQEEEEEDLEQTAFQEIEKPPVVATAPRKPQSVRNPKPRKQSSANKGQTQAPKSPTKGKGKLAAPPQLAFPTSTKAGGKRNPSPTLQTPPPAAPIQLMYEGSTDGGSVFPSDGEDEEDMEPVDTLGAEEDQGQEVDADAFARELEDIMDEEEDDSVMYRVEEPPARNTGGPVSLNAYAGGGYNDDSSSSDESEG